MCVMRCPPDKRREALLQLDAAHNPELQVTLSGAVKAMYNQPEARWEGLWVSVEAGRLTGAIWVQPLASGMAQLWLPRTRVQATTQESLHGADARTDALLSAAYQWVERNAIRLCHVALSAHETVLEALLLKHGMQRLVCLEHLTGSTHRRLAMNKEKSLDLQSFSELSQAHQRDLMAAVGEKALDSVRLREMLTVDELLEGFYQQDPQAPKHWYVVHYYGQVIGVLLLADRPALGGWELMLMGLTPAWRGKGLGRSLLNKALALAQQAGAQEMMLSVDDVNTPAKRLYQQAGLVCYAQQHLLAWKENDKRHTLPT